MSPNDPSSMRKDFFDELKKRSNKSLLTPDVLNQAKEELAKYEGVSGEAFDDTIAKQQIKPSNVRLDTFNEMKSLAKRRKLTPEIFNQKKEDLNKYAGVSPELFDSTMAKNKIQPSGSPMRYEYMDELKKLSGAGKLTTETLNKAKEELGKYEGVSGKAFDSAMAKNKIKGTSFSSPEEATNRAIYEANYGSPLTAMDIRSNDSGYKFGSGGALSQGLTANQRSTPATRVSPESTKYRNAERRLRRKGYTKQAGEMAMQRELVRMGEPRIDTPELRSQRMAQKIQAGREAQRQDKAYADSEKPRFFQNITSGLGITEKEKKEDSKSSIKDLRDPMDNWNRFGEFGYPPISNQSYK